MIETHNNGIPLVKKARAAVVEYRSYIMLLMISGGSLALSLGYFISRGF